MKTLLALTILSYLGYTLTEPVLKPIGESLTRITAISR